MGEAFLMLALPSACRPKLAQVRAPDLGPVQEEAPWPDLDPDPYPNPEVVPSAKWNKLVDILPNRLCTWHCDC